MKQVKIQNISLCDMVCIFLLWIYGTCKIFDIIYKYPCVIPLYIHTYQNGLIVNIMTYYDILKNQIIYI